MRGQIFLPDNLQKGNPSSISIAERERLGSLMPNNRRSLTFSSKQTRDPRSLVRKGSVQITVDRPINSYHRAMVHKYLSVMQHSQYPSSSIHFNLIQYLNFNINIIHFIIPFHISVSLFNFFPFLTIIIPNMYYINLSHLSCNNPPPTRIPFKYKASNNFLYTKIIVFERQRQPVLYENNFSKIIYIQRVRKDFKKIPANVTLNVIVRLSVITCRPQQFTQFFNVPFLMPRKPTCIHSYNNMEQNDKYISFPFIIIKRLSRILSYYPNFPHLCTMS